MTIQEMLPGLRDLGVPPEVLSQRYQLGIGFDQRRHVLDDTCTVDVEDMALQHDLLAFEDIQAHHECDCLTENVGQYLDWMVLAKLGEGLSVLHAAVDKDATALGEHHYNLSVQERSLLPYVSRLQMPPGNSSLLAPLRILQEQFHAALVDTVQLLREPGILRSYQELQEDGDKDELVLLGVNGYDPYPNGDDLTRAIFHSYAQEAHPGCWILVLPHFLALRLIQWDQDTALQGSHDMEIHLLEEEDTPEVQEIAGRLWNPTQGGHLTHLEGAFAAARRLV